MTQERSMIDWFRHVVFDNYTNFEGRARRAEYWWFVLAGVCVMLPIYFLGLAMIGMDIPFLGTIFMGIYLIIALGLFIPQLAVGVRRLHDTNRSGWWLLLSLVPVIGSIVLLVFLASEGTQGSNSYGQDPKASHIGDPIDHLKPTF